MRYVQMATFFKQFKKSIESHKWFLVVILIGTVIRIALNSAVDSFDFYAFVMWAEYLSTHRMADVFEFLPDGYTPYPPLYYYVLKLIGFFITFINVWDNKWLTYLIVRMPMIFGDIAVAWLVYQFAQKYLSKKTALWGVIFYFLHPAIIYNTSIWGQIDSIVTLLGLVSIVAFFEKKPFWGIGIYVLGVITKLQILALLPLTFFLSIVSSKFKRLVHFSSFWLGIATLPFLPIVFAKGLKWTWDYFFTIPNWYAYTSVYTYNLWAPLGFIVSDNTKFFGLIQYKYIGIFLFWLVAYFILKPLFKVKNRTPLAIMFAAFLLWYDFSFFATRIHSRYLIYSFGFFAPFFARYPRLGIMLSILMIANLLLPTNVPSIMGLIKFMTSLPVIIFFVFYAFYFFLLSYKTYLRIISGGK